MHRLEEIRNRTEKATAGPWEVDGMDAGHSQYEGNWWIQAGNVGDVICDMDGLQRSKNEEVAQDDGRDDAYFIANAREDIPWLIDELEKSQAKLAGIEKLLTQRRTSIADYRRIEKMHLDAYQVELAHDYRNAARAEEHLVTAVESAMKVG